MDTRHIINILAHKNSNKYFSSTALSEGLAAIWIQDCIVSDEQELPSLTDSPFHDFFSYETINLSTSKSKV